MNDDGGIIDDLMVSRPARPSDAGTLMLVVNAARKERDFAHIGARMIEYRSVGLIERKSRALIALQGPRAVEALKDRLRGIEAMAFMSFMTIGAALITRSGYTGEDGYEISLPASQIDAFANDLLDDERVIAFFQPERERFLEYDLTKLIWELSNPRRQGWFSASSPRCHLPTSEQW